MANAPEIASITVSQLEDLLSELRLHLPAAIYQRIESLLRTLQWLMSVIEQKKTSIARLKRMIFGHKTEKTNKILNTASPGAGTSSTNGKDSTAKPKRKGHGRKGAKDYPGAKRVPVPHPDHKAGDRCPKCLKAKLYLLAPARIISIVAQPIFSATLYELQRLRCAVCGVLFTAPPPPQAGLAKYAPSVGIMLAIMRYGAGLPMYRMDTWQNHFGVPLAASTQWEQIDAASKTPQLVCETLIDQAAQGTLMHNDDTTMRVQSLRQEISQTEGGAKRTGIFTTSIISQVGQYKVALFFTGKNHAGENLDQLLKRRAPGLATPLQMCDALSRNEPSQFKTILCNCIPHGRRNFVDLLDSFPKECRKVIETLREIYRVDALAKEQNLSDLQRLSLHQEQSHPLMDQLHRWMKDQFDQKQVEPNSGLGQAIRYMLKHWEPLTRFLHVPGAPLDNNICERALKTAIMHRKNSMSYKTVRGAQVGDTFMSLIHTCQLNAVNPFDYLMVLQQHATEVEKDPARWLPWNYREALELLNTS